MKTMKKVSVFEVRFVVEGAGDFPMDMLRYDTCFPATEDDARRAALQNGTRQVTVIGRSLAGRVPTEGRWASFGWKVIEHLEVAQ
jgi:hypothetical protein